MLHKPNKDERAREETRRSAAAKRHAKLLTRRIP
jgi:hypothetical protein